MYTRPNHAFNKLISRRADALAYSRALDGVIEIINQAVIEALDASKKGSN